MDLDKTMKGGGDLEVVFAEDFARWRREQIELRSLRSHRIS